MPKRRTKLESVGTADVSAPERLLTAAVETFGERGYHATTTREIAEHAGMSSAGMYIHFPSKQEILYQVARRGHASVLEAVEKVWSTDALPEVQVQRFVSAFTSWHAWNHRSARVQQYELHALAREHYEEIRQVRARFTRMLKSALDRGVESGAFTIIADIDVTAVAILSLGIDVARWYRPEVGPDPETLGQQYAQLVLMMLGAGPDAAQER